MKRFSAVVLIGIFTFLLIGCNAATDLPTSTPTNEIVQLGAYPSPIGSSAYPMTDGGQGSPLLITPNPPREAAQPEPGKGSISGTLYSPLEKMVIPDTQFYLTAGWGDNKNEVPPVFVGPQVDKGDIDLRSDSQGNFSINNIPPGNYYLAVWAPFTWDIAQVSDKDTKPLLLEIKADQKYVLGIVNVSWP